MRNHKIQKKMKTLNEIQEVRFLLAKYPNSMQLGQKVHEVALQKMHRSYFWEKTKTLLNPNNFIAGEQIKYAFSKTKKKKNKKISFLKFLILTKDKRFGF